MVEIQTLEQCPHFAELDQESLSRLAFSTKRMTFPADTRIFKEGEDADTLYVILRGKVEIRYPLGDGKNLSIQTLTNDELLVWAALIAPYKTTSEGIAVEETLVLAIDARALRESFETDAALAFILTHQVAKMLARRLDTARCKFAKLVQNLHDVLEHSRD